MLEVAGATVTDATDTGAGALTEKEADAVLPSAVAVIEVLPGATAETSPASDTAAIAVFADCQVTTRSVRELPALSLMAAIARAVCPTTTAVGVIATLTLATGVGGRAATLNDVCPVTPSLT